MRRRALTTAPITALDTARAPALVRALVTGLSTARLAAFALLITGCSAPQFAVEPRLDQPAISGQVAVAEPGQPLQSNDVESALDLGSDDSAFGARADVRFGSPHIVLSFLGSDFEGEGTLTGQLSDDGVVLPAGTQVGTDVEFGLYSGVMTFDMVPSDTVEVGLGFGLYVADLDATVVSRDAGNPGTIDLETTLPIPVLALQAAIELGSFDLRGLVSGMHLQIDGDEATFYDLDFGARYRLFDSGVSGSIGLGWRYSRLDAEYEDDDDNASVDLRLSGPYLGITIAF